MKKTNEDQKLPRNNSRSTCSCCSSTASTELNELIRLATVLQITGISRPQVYVLMRQRRFPQGVKLGRATAWVRNEVNEWVRQRIAERDAALAA